MIAVERYGSGLSSLAWWPAIYFLCPTSAQTLGNYAGLPSSGNEQRREKRTHVEIVSRKGGDILAAIKLSQKFQATRISSALFAWLASLPMCIGVNFSEC